MPLVLHGGSNNPDDKIREAVAHGIAKAISTIDGDTRTKLKRAGLLTRDSRVKERHKYGLKKARKAPQFSKR